MSATARGVHCGVVLEPLLAGVQKVVLQARNPDDCGCPKWVERIIRETALTDIGADSAMLVVRRDTSERDGPAGARRCIAPNVLARPSDSWIGDEPIRASAAGSGPNSHNGRRRTTTRMPSMRSRFAQSRSAHFCESCHVSTAPSFAAASSRTIGWMPAVSRVRGSSARSSATSRSGKKSRLPMMAPSVVPLDPDPPVVPARER
jgi:hypothetical protein